MNKTTPKKEVEATSTLGIEDTHKNNCTHRGGVISEVETVTNHSKSGELMLRAITVRAATRTEVGKGFQEVGLSLSYTIGGNQPDLNEVIDVAAEELMKGYVKLLLRVDQCLD